MIPKSVIFFVQENIMSLNDPHAATRGSGTIKRRFTISLAILLGFAIVIYGAFQLSPWPSAMLIRMAFDRGARIASDSLEKHVPEDVSSLLNEHYDTADTDAYLDVFFPTVIANSTISKPTIVWVHGGGWVSGNKSYLSNYLKILASKGYTVIAIGYSIAPEKKYPTPVDQTNSALAYIKAHADRLHVDTTHIFLSGDSGGAQIAAQVANVLTSREYARTMGIVPAIDRLNLRGVLLYCGAYDVTQIDLKGPFGYFLKTILWSYTGDRNFTDNKKLEEASIIDHLTPQFPPTFISVGNADPLEPQSQEFAKRLNTLGVLVDALFFSSKYEPQLPHEYQFNLDIDAGKLALYRSIQFVADRSR